MERKSVIDRLSQYGVSPRTGFLPEVEPLQMLPDPRFSSWERLIHTIPARLHARNVRDAIKALPELDASPLLQSEPEMRRALLVLSILAHAYVWGERPFAHVIPACVAKPLVQIADALGQPPILVCDSICSRNWGRFDAAKPIQLGNLFVNNHFYGGVDEAWFYLVTVAIEAQGAKALLGVCSAQDHVDSGDAQGLTDDLFEIKGAVKEMTDTLARMPERCSPWGFYHRVREFLAGWTSHAFDEHGGVVYEGCFDGKPQKFHGGSAAQSALTPALDAALGVVHDSKHSRDYLKAMRAYMPRKFRNFVESVEDGPSIREFVERHGPSSPELKVAFNGATLALKQFRDLHIQIVCRYIINQSPKKREIQGTGGTTILPFLKSSRDETAATIVE